MQVDFFHFVRGVEQKDRPKPNRPSAAVMEGMREARRFDRRRGISYITS